MCIRFLRLIIPTTIKFFCGESKLEYFCEKIEKTKIKI